MNYGSWRLRTRWRLPCVRSSGLALFLVCAVSSACASGGTGSVPTGSSTTGQGRPPVAGDFLRVECVSLQHQEIRVGEGIFLGAEGGDLLLGVGPQSQSVAVPFANVSRVEVRGHRSRSGVSAVIGGLVGAVAGGFQGSSNFDTGSRSRSGFHFPREVYVTFGAVVGSIGGAVVGRILGSFIKTDTWLDAPWDWVVQYSELGSETPEASAPAGACPSFDTETR